MNTIKINSCPEPSLFACRRCPCQFKSSPRGRRSPKTALDAAALAAAVPAAAAAAAAAPAAPAAPAAGHAYTTISCMPSAASIISHCCVYGCQGPAGPGRGNFKYTQGVRNQQPGTPFMPPQQQGEAVPQQQTMPSPVPQVCAAVFSCC